MFMSSKNKLRFIGALLLVASPLAAAQTLTFSSTAPLVIPGSGTTGPASPYPSSIAVSGVTGPVSQVTVDLLGLSHTSPDDLDILLVGPTGASVLLMSDVGGPHDIAGIDLVFDDAAAGFLPDGSQMSSGSYKPTNGHGGGSDSFLSPAPAGPYGTTLSVFDALDANGIWKLFISDDQRSNVGLLAGGWRLNIDPPPPPVGAVPEPASLALLGIGLAGLGVVGRRTR